MKLKIRSLAKIILCLIILAFVRIAIFGQNQILTQKNDQIILEETYDSIPKAIPILTPEEAEAANKEAIIQMEVEREEEIKRCKEISSVISHRKNKLFLNSISIILIIMIHISIIGYCNFFRRKLRIHWSNTMMYEACALAIIIMISGMLHVMKPVTCLVLWIGLLLFAYQFFCINKKWSFPSLKRIQEILFRPEYFFMLCATVGSYYVLFQYKKELYSSDIWHAWLQQYHYLLLNDKWADIEYKNYASGYAMIINGVSYYFATILKNTGTQIWVYGHLWFSIMMLMPIFHSIKWHNLPISETLSIALLLLHYRLYGKNNPSSFLYVFFLIFLFFLLAKQVLFSKKKSVCFSNSIILILGMLLCFYVLSSPLAFCSYPLDTVLGCATIGVFFSLSWSLFHYGFFTWRVYLHIIPLVVLSLIKPTGVIPALLNSLCISLGIIYYFFTSYHKQKNKFKSIFLTITAFFIVASSPIVAYKLWNSYASFNKLHYQHSVSPGEMTSKAISQIKDGCSEEELMTWHKKIRSMSIITGYSLYDPQKGKAIKSTIEKTIEDFCQIYFSKHPTLDFDESFANPRQNSSHVAIVSFILLIISIFCLLFVKKRGTYSYLIIFSIVAYFIFVVNQYYFAPMFTNIPGLFRYFYPAYTLVIGVTFLGIFSLFNNRQILCGSLSAILLLTTLYPHLFSFVASPAPLLDDTQSTVGYTMLATINSDHDIPFLLQDQTYEKCIYNCLVASKRIEPSKKIISSLPSSIETPFLTCLSSILSPVKKYNFTNISESGIYMAFPKDSSQLIDLRPLFLNRDAANLLNDVYYLSDIYSFDYSPWTERKLDDLNGQKWSIPSTNNDIKEDTNKITIFSMNKRYTLWDKTFKFCFAQDYIRFIGRFSRELNFSVVLGLYEKSDTDQKYKWIKQIPMTTQNSPLNLDKKEFEFKADLNLADVPTDKLNLYYRIGIVFEPETEGEMRDFHLYQYVSGKLNLEPALAELEQSEQSNKQEEDIQ